MRLTRSTFLPLLVASAAACVALWPAQAVEARSNDTVYVQRVFSNLPGDEVLAAMQQPQDPPLPDGKGKDLALKYCTMCHAATVWSRQHHTADQWNSLIDNMVSKGLTAPDEDLATISDYLTANFGPLKKDAGAAPPAPPAAR